MTDPEQSTDHDLRLRLYGETRADLLKRQLSNSENADRAILTVSTAALGFSLAFLKDVVPIQAADYSWLLYLSWLFFPAAIIATLLSLFTSQKAIAEQMDLAHRYYIEHEEGAANLQPEYASITEMLNRAGAVLLVTGLLVTCIYVFINLEKGNVMANIKINGGSASQTVQKGANIPAMQTVPQSGAPVPAMQQVPQPAPVAPSATSGGSKGN